MKCIFFFFFGFFLDSLSALIWAVAATESFMLPVFSASASLSSSFLSFPRLLLRPGHTPAQDFCLSREARRKILSNSVAKNVGWISWWGTMWLVSASGNLVASASICHFFFFFFAILRLLSLSPASTLSTQKQTSNRLFAVPRFLPCCKTFFFLPSSSSLRSLLLAEEPVNGAEQLEMAPIWLVDFKFYSFTFSLPFHL